MIDLPKDVLRSPLASQLIRGNVLRTKIIFPQGPRFKRLILLNNNFSEDDIYYIHTTSQVGIYKINKNHPAFKDNFIYLQKGQTRFNSNENMVINCREVYEIKKEKLLENYKNKILNFLGIMPKKIMTEIDTIISVSRLISPKIKTHIILNHT